MPKKKEHEEPQIESSSSANTDPSTQNEATVRPELESLLQVRELLVGPVANDVAERMAKLDQRLEWSLREFQETSQRRTDSVEKSVQSELGKLNEELNSFRGQQTDRVGQLERELNLGLEQMKGTIQEITDNVTKTTDALRGDLAQEFDGIRSTMEQLFEQISGRLDQEKQHLRDELVDRDTLSAALSEVAMRLAPAAAGAHEIDPNQPDIEIDQILDAATSEQI